MKTIATLIAVFAFALSSAQVLCIKCYNQNARVLNYSNDLIVNGGFENGCGVGAYFCPNASQYNCDIVNWVCTGGGIATYAHIIDSFSFSKVPEGTKSPYFGNLDSKVCTTFDTSCINNLGCSVTSIPIGFPYSYSGYGGIKGVSLEQTVTGLIPSNIYLIEFWAGGEASPSWMSKEGIFAVDIGFGNIFLKDPATLPDSGIGKRYVIVFAATSSTHIIKFTNWGHICSQCTELVLDDVRLFESTEPLPYNPCATSINDLTKDIVTVFPNPATNLLTVTTNTNTHSEIILYDIASRKLMEEKFIKEVSLNIAHLAKGIYLYQVTDEKSMIARGKVVKE